MDALETSLARRCAGRAPQSPLATHAAAVVADASADGLQLERALAEPPPPDDVPVDHLVLLTARAWCNIEGEEMEPGAT